MTNSAINRKIVSAIRQQLSEALSAEIGPDFVVIHYPQGFATAIQYGQNWWNPNTFSLLDKLATPNGDGTADIDTAPFSTLFANVLGNSEFVLSASDKAEQTATLTEFSQTEAQMIAEFEKDFGAITAAQMAAQGTKPPIKSQYIADYVKTNYPGTPPDFPISLTVFGNAFTNWTELSHKIEQFSTNQRRAQTLLSAGQTNVRTPSSLNGALQTSATTWAVAYTGLPDNNTLQSSLESAKGMTVEVSFDNDGVNELALFFAHEKVGAVPKNTLQVSVQESPTAKSLDVSDLFQNAAHVEMEIKYTGLTIVSAEPCELSADFKTGWYSSAAVHQIASKTGSDTSGLQLSSSTYDAATLFGPGKRFARVKTYVLSNDPKITMKIHGDAADRLLGVLQGKPKVALELGSMVKFGTNSAGYVVDNADGQDGIVIASINPTVQSGTVPTVDRRTHLIGGILGYPD